MFLFDATTLAIIFPTAVMAALFYAAYLQRPENRRLKRLSRPLLKLEKRTRIIPVQTNGQIRAYAIGLTLAAILQTLFLSLNFWHIQTNAAIPELVASGTFIQTILKTCGCQLLSMSIAFPLFFAMELVLTQRAYEKLHQKIRWQMTLHLFLFISVGLITLPIIQAALSSMGFSQMSSWLVKDMFRVGIALSTIPTSILGVWIALDLQRSRRLEGIEQVDIRNYYDYLKDENFNFSFLDEKTDEEINKIIGVANYLGDLDKADVISNALVMRHVEQQT